VPYNLPGGIERRIINNTKMEEKELTEKESLELITRMIQSTKENLEVGRGNKFLTYGYFTAALGIVIFLLLFFTHNDLYSLGWCLMFACWAFVSWKSKKPDVITYTDKAIQLVWHIMNWMFVITFAFLLIFAVIFHVHYGLLDLMMPLSLIYANIGTSITGVILKEKWMTLLPLMSLLIAFYMLAVMRSGSLMYVSWNLLMSFAFLISMVIPGHILKHKMHN
jgi:hypothetical protein